MAQEEDVLIEKDSVFVLTDLAKIGIQQNDKRVEFKPNPTKAVIYSAIFPGLGQIYNRKYWKLPIVYGGFIGCTYAITWNSTQYNDYKELYRGISNRGALWVDYVSSGGKTDGDSWRDLWYAFLRSEGVKNPEKEGEWLDFLRSRGRLSETYTQSGITFYTGTFKNGKDNFRRNRDLSIFITVGLYALCILDAYVDAQLFDFDISPDLSMRVEPVIFNKSNLNSSALGLQCSIKF
jgi:hypothetical protein